MHDVLMANQDRLELQCIYGYAERVGLNMARFDVDMDDEVYLPTVREHIAFGMSQGVVRTPTFFVNGAMVDCSGGLATLYAATEVAISPRYETLGRAVCTR